MRAARASERTFFKFANTFGKTYGCGQGDARLNEVQPERAIDKEPGQSEYGGVTSAKVIYLHCNTSWKWHFEKYASALRKGGAEVELVEFHHGRRLDWIVGLCDGQMTARRFGRPLEIRCPIRMLREFERMWVRWVKFADGRRLSRYLAGSKATHLVAADPWALEFCVRAKARNHAKVFYVVLEPYRHEIGGGERRKREVIRLERRNMPQVSGAFFMGKSIVQDYAGAYGGGDRFHILFNGWPLGLKPRRKALRQTAGIPAGQTVILYTGFICPIKGVSDVVAALARLPASVVFVLIGFGDMEELKAEARLAGVGDRVILLPAVAQKELMDYAADADIGIIPFRKENTHVYGCPGKMFEFMAAGLPLVVSDTPDMREMVLTHRLGEVFKAGDPADLARALRPLVESPEYRRQCAANSLQSHQSTFCWEEQSRKLAGIILG